MTYIRVMIVCSYNCTCTLISSSDRWRLSHTVDSSEFPRGDRNPTLNSEFCRSVGSISRGCAPGIEIEWPEKLQ